MTERSGLGGAFSAAHKRIELGRLERSIRSLELELGLREWDARDSAEATQRIFTQIRYVDELAIEEFIESEKERLTPSDSFGYSTNIRSPNRVTAATR